MSVIRAERLRTTLGNPPRNAVGSALVWLLVGVLVAQHRIVQHRIVQHASSTRCRNQRSSAE